MKKLLFWVGALLVTGEAHAQFGIQGGVNFSNYNYEAGGTKLDRNGIVAFNAGIDYRSWGGFLGVQPSLVYSMKGARNYDTPPASGIDYYNNRLHYLQFSMPVMLRVPLFYDDWNTGFDIGAGPYVSGLLQATRTTHTSSGRNENTDYKIGNGRNDDFRPVDAGISLLVGVKAYHVGFYAGYEAGLANITPVNNETIRTSTFHVDMHLFFRK